jgi:hypothetical protein
MKKTILTIFCITLVSTIFPVTSFASEFTDRAILAFQEYRQTNDEIRNAFLSGDMASLGEKRELLETRKENFTHILRSLPGEYCADPQADLLREFVNILTNITDEYPTYVLAELYACDSDTVINEIQSLAPEDQKKLVDDLSYGYKNITYKIESLPNYKELSKKLDKLKNTILKRD